MALYRCNSRMRLRSVVSVYVCFEQSHIPQLLVVARNKLHMLTWPATSRTGMCNCKSQEAPTPVVARNKALKVLIYCPKKQ